MLSDDGQGEASFVAKTIKMMVDKGKFKYSDCAVLYRMNALSRNIETTLHNAGIPFRVYGGMRFYDRREIKDTLSYLRLIHDYSDNIAFERIINVPKRGIGDQTIEKLRQIAMDEGISMFEVSVNCRKYPDLLRAAGKLIPFTELIEQMRDELLKNEKDFAAFVDYVENESGIIDAVIAEREKKGEVIDRVENLKELLSEAAEYDKAHRAAPVDMETLEIEEKGSGNAEDVPLEVDDDFFFDTATSDTTEGILGLYLENCSLFTEGDSYDDNDDFVKLMTIHSAKGLEFDHVIVFLDGPFCEVSVLLDALSSLLFSVSLGYLVAKAGSHAQFFGNILDREQRTRYLAEACMMVKDRCDTVSDAVKYRSIRTCLGTVYRQMSVDVPPGTVEYLKEVSRIVSCDRQSPCQP